MISSRKIFVHEISFTLLIFLFLAVASAQVTTIPAFPTTDDTLEIIFDATQGTGGLVGASSVHIHTGVIADSPTSTSWINVVGQWGNPASPGQMTSLDNVLW